MCLARKVTPHVIDASSKNVDLLASRPLHGVLERDGNLALRGNLPHPCLKTATAAVEIKNDRPVSSVSSVSSVSFQFAGTRNEGAQEESEQQRSEEGPGPEQHANR